jgi:Mn2+/Fe2+ NRAMP family transporter
MPAGTHPPGRTGDLHGRAPPVLEFRAMDGSPPPRVALWRQLGPGLLIAATGVGAGDVVAAAASGSRFGYAVLWAVAFGAVLKYVLNEGLARWQLATGTTLVEGWTQRLGRGFQFLFLLYLIPWSFVVGGALISACGLAAHAVAPVLSVQVWGVIHSLAAAVTVLLGSYRRFEGVMKVFIGVMFIGLVGCALTAVSPARMIARGVTEAAVPPGGVGFLLGVMGGVGGSVTLLSYGYWMREKGWEGPGRRRLIRVDLGVAYALTGLFGLAVVVLAAEVLHARDIVVQGNSSVLVMGDMMESALGAAGAWAFRLGFWAAVATSILGVWQGIPYLFCDFVALLKKLPPDRMRALVSTRSIWYRGYLAFLCLPPLALLHFERPVAVILVYAAVGSLFMPFLAGTLLYMNSRTDWVGREMASGWITNGLLVLVIVLFGYLGWVQIARMFGPSGGPG